MGEERVAGLIFNVYGIIYALFLGFITYSFDNPFAGYSEIDNFPFEYALKTIEKHSW